MFRRRWAVTCRLFLILATICFGVGMAAIGMAYPPLVVVFAAAAAWKACRRLPEPGTTHGSGRVATQGEIERRGLYRGGGDSLIFGRALGQRPSKIQAVAGIWWPLQRSEKAVRRFLDAFLNGKWYCMKFLHINDFCHILTVAPSGSGKGVSSVILNMLHYAGNVLAFDCKGELFEATAKHRAKLFGPRRVIRLDPAGVHGPGDTFNMLDMLDPMRVDFIESCKDMAAAMVIRTGMEKDTHWLDTCEIICASVIAFVKCCIADPAKHHFSMFRYIVTSPERFAEAIRIMKERTELDGLMSILGNMLSCYQGDELNSIFSTVHRMTGFLDSKMVADNTASTSFPLDVLKAGKADAYLIVQPPLLSALAPLVRLWLFCLTRRFTQGGPSEAKKLLVIVDEAAVLGRQKAIEEGITLMRSYGLRIWLIFQSLEQAKTCFGDNADVVLDNLTTQQYFCISSLSTAKILSERIGDATILIHTLNETYGDSYQAGGGPNRQITRSRSVSTTTAPHARRVLQANEIINFPASLGMVFHKNMHMIPARLARYYDAQEFAEIRPGSGIRGTGRPHPLGGGVGLQAFMVFLAGVLFLFTMIALGERKASQPSPVDWPMPGANGPVASPYGYGQPYQTPALPHNLPARSHRPTPRTRQW